MISWGLRGTQYQNTLNDGRGRMLKTALQPQLIIHIVSHSFFLLILKSNIYGIYKVPTRRTIRNYGNKRN